MSTDPVATADDDAIRACVARLSRRHKSGGRVIERAAILAEGSNSGAIMAWIVAHAWVPEALPPAPPSAGLSGLHGMRREQADARPAAPRRYVSPPA